MVGLEIDKRCIYVQIESTRKYIGITWRESGKGWGKRYLITQPVPTINRRRLVNLSHGWRGSTRARMTELSVDADLEGVSISI